MELSYWQSRWKKGAIGWHMDTVFPPLKTYWNRLNLKAGSRVLVPLCGKSLDIDWLLEQKHHVIGVDISKRALEAVMRRTSSSLKESTKGSFTCYKSASLQLWCGDFFKLRKKWLPAIDAIYDKAALIALPPEQRQNYASHIKSLIQPNSQILLNSFEYKQHEMTGPPFAVFEEEIRTYYQAKFSINLLQERSLFNDLTNFHRRGLQSYLTEKIYHLSPNM